MTIHFVFAGIYALVLLWAIVSRAEPAAIILVLVLVHIAASFSYAKTFYRYEKIFVWFKRNVHITRDSIPYDAPDDLVDEEEDDID